MAKFGSTVVITNALDQIGNCSGEDLEWQASGEFQSLVLSHLVASREAGQTLTKEQILGMSAHSCGPVNAFLALNGFESIQLADLGSGPHMAYAASIMKLLGNWLDYGNTGYALLVPKNQPFVFRPSKNLFHYVSESGQRMVCVQTDSGFDMWLVNDMKSAGNGFDMIAKWQTLLAGAKITTGNGAVLPFVAIEQAKGDIKDLAGMRAGQVVIQEALAAANFKLTPMFIKFEMAVALSAKSMSLDMESPEPDDFVVGDHLNFALTRRGILSMPLAVGQVPASEFSKTKEVY